MKGKGRNLLILLGVLSVFAAGCGGSGGTGGTGDEWENLITVDATPPVIIVTNPVNGATNVPINTRITATFSEAMDPATINTTTFTLTGPSGLVPGRVTYAGTTAVFTPGAFSDTDLADTTLYTATITSGATDLAGNALVVPVPSGPGPVPNPWTFTTGAFRDETRPRVIFTDPANGAVNVPPNQKITADFSEVMDPTTIDTATFLLSGPLGAVTGKVAYAGTTAVFTPIDSLTGADTDLVAGAYTALITAGAEDLSGNALVVIQTVPVPDPWSFTVGPPRNTTAPIITFTDPVDDPAGADTPVAINHAVSATFSKPMNPATIIAGVSFILNETISGDTVLGTVSFVTNADTTIATFTPGSNLTPNIEYTATITNMAEDLDGDTLVVPQFVPVPDPWHFWTGADTELTQGVIDLGLAGSYGIMARSSLSNSGFSVINGDVALMATISSLTGFTISTSPGPGIINGTTHLNDSVALATYNDLVAAYNFAKAMGVDYVVGTANLGGLQPDTTLPVGTFPPGVFSSGSTMLISTPLTLDAGGDANAFWVFQIGSALTTNGTGSVLLLNGAQAKNVFFVTGLDLVANSGDATISAAASSTFNGNILAGNSISTTAGNIINGRLLSGAAAPFAGSITLINTTVNVPAP